MVRHICDALVITCIDFRFRKYIRAWLEKNFTTSDYDMVAIAGSSKDLRTVAKQLDISVHLHYINRVIIIHHEDCGAYGKKSTKTNHVKDMKKTKVVVNSLYPEISVDLYYLHLDGKFEKI